MHRRMPLTIALLLVLLLAACGERESPGGGAPPDASPAAWPTPTEPSLLDHPVTEWLLAELDGAAPLAGSLVVLDLAARTEGRLEGWSDCANFFAMFEADASRFAISTAEPFAGVQASERPCQTPEGGKEQDDRFYAALNATTSYTLTAERLELRDDAGTPRLVFVPRPPFELDPALTGVEWVLWSLDGAPPAVDAPVTVAFTDEQLSGSDGCNSVFGALIAASDGRLTIAGIGGSEMACEEPVMAQAARVTELLLHARGYRVEPGLLEVLDADGAAVLAFAPAGPSVAPELLGIPWVLTRLGDAAPLPGSEPTLDFSANGASGHDGCNAFAASSAVVAWDGTFTFPPPSRETQGCDPAIMEQADRLITALRAATSYAIDGDTLAIMDDAGHRLLAFTRSALNVDPALIGVPWVLQSLDGEVTIAGIPITFDLSAGGYSGHDGCNWFGGTLLAAADGVLTLGPRVQTTAGCPPPDGTTAQSERLHAALDATTGYRLVDGRLELLDGQGQTRLTFAPRAADPLLDTTWRLLLIMAPAGDTGEMQGNGLIEGTELTLEFGPDAGSRQVGGSDGCNTFGGTYAVDGDTIAFDGFLSTLMACMEPAGVMDQGRAYLEILLATTRWSWQGNTLTLTAPDGRALEFVATR